jgi:hypothetical protein
MLGNRVKWAASVLVAAAVITVAIVLVGGPSAAAASKIHITCPDGGNGVQVAGWDIVCKGQTALGSTVTVTYAKFYGVDLTVTSPPVTDPFVNADSSFDTTSARAAFTYSGSGGSSSITVTATPPGGRPPTGVAMGLPRKKLPGKIRVT